MSAITTTCVGTSVVAPQVLERAGSELSQVTRASEKREVPDAAVAPQEITLDACYQRLLTDPARAVQALNAERVAGLSRIVADYLSRA